MTETETTTITKEEAKVSAPQKIGPISGYVEGLGRRKTATARVRLSDAKKTKFIINGKEGVREYFPTDELVKTIMSPFEALKLDREFEVSALVDGGGVHAQAEAVRHGISRALLKLDPHGLRSTLKKAGYLKRDPRKKERKKPGLRKARKRAQWSKR